MTTLMGADLNNIVKCQALSDEHVQFLVYQLLRGLKVGHVGSGSPSPPRPLWVGAERGGAWAHSVCPPMQYIHSAGIIHRVGAAEGEGHPLCLGSWPYHTHALCTLQDLKPSNVAVNEDCELRVRVLRGARVVGTYQRGRYLTRYQLFSRSWTLGWHARLMRR